MTVSETVSTRYVSGWLHNAFDWQEIDIDAGRVDVRLEDDISMARRVAALAAEPVYLTLESDTKPTGAFKAETIMDILEYQLGVGRDELLTVSDGTIRQLHALLFDGGEIEWQGLAVRVDAFMQSEFMRNTASSRQVSKTNPRTQEAYQYEYIKPSQVRRILEPFIPEAGDSWQVNLGIEGSSDQKQQSFMGRLVTALNVEQPSGRVGMSDIFLLADHYRETGQVLLSTDEQFCMTGDAQRGANIFWALQQHESDQRPTGQKGSEQLHHEDVLMLYQDGSKRLEAFDEQRGIARIIYETSGHSFLREPTDQAGEPVASFVAGYGRMNDIPYLPKWMLESDFGDLPYTVLLDVYPDRYNMTIKY